MNFMNSMLRSALACLLLATTAHAVEFPGGAYRPPYAFLRELSTESRAVLAPTVRSTVLFGGRATGFLISADGWVVTASHVISDAVIGPTSDCARLKAFLHHERGEDGSADAQLIRAECAEVREFSVSDDFALLKLRFARPVDLSGAWAPIALEDGDAAVGDTVHVASHPHARDFGRSHRVVSSGELVLKDPSNEQLPHFLHLANTDGGSSGAPVFNQRGQVVGLHIRGVSQFGEAIPVQVGGKNTSIRDFNIAVWMPYLARKYGLAAYALGKH